MEMDRKSLQDGLVNNNAATATAKATATIGGFAHGSSAVVSNLNVGTSNQLGGNVPHEEAEKSLIYVRYEQTDEPQQVGKNLYIYKLYVYYQRYILTIFKSFEEVLEFQQKMISMYPRFMKSKSIKFLKSRSCFDFFSWFCCNNKIDPVKEREDIVTFLTSLMMHMKKIDQPYFKISTLSNFLGVTANTFNNPQFGKLAIEGYFKKSSGGFFKNYGGSFGDYITVWSNRYIVFRSTHIAWYHYQTDMSKPQGIMLVDNAFQISLVKTTIIVKNKCMTKRFSCNTNFFSGDSTRNARQTYEVLRKFYGFYFGKSNFRMLPALVPGSASYPVRLNVDCRVYTLPCDYFAAVAVHLLAAQKEIFITSWKNSPHVYLTKPPLPPLSLDQILKFKADQGVKIYILLYKEVEMSGTGNNSYQALDYLMGLSPNISVIRHPNKFVGGSTALLWSHHEKIVVIDRNIGFVGGIDLAYNRWDDKSKSLSDEYGVMFPGRDYRQPGIGKYQPARNVSNVNIVRQKTNQRTDVVEDDGEDDEEVHFEADDASSVVSSSAFDSSSNTAVTVASALKSATNLTGRIISTAMRRGTTIGDNKKLILEVRDLYPRMPWHDVHAAISGASARDLGNHFVHRWNHHIISTRVNSEVLYDITDEEFFSVCGQCMRQNMSESFTHCPDPNCNYYLGPTSYFLQPLRAPRLPIKPDKYSYITFTCVFRQALGNIGSLLDSISLYIPKKTDFSVYYSPTVLSGCNEKILNIVSSSLDETHGPSHEKLMVTGKYHLVPANGDIIVNINGQPANHLDHAAVARLIKIFEREDETKSILSSRDSSVIDMETSFRDAELEFDDRDSVADGVFNHITPPGTPNFPRRSDIPFKCFYITFRRHVLEPIDVNQNEQMVITAPKAMEHHTTELKFTPETLPIVNVRMSSIDLSNDIQYSMNPILGKAKEIVHEVGDRTGLLVNHRYYCEVEQNLMMGKLFYENRFSIDHLSAPASRGTCNVQVLRSIGPWSAGVDAECSIQLAYIDLIKNAEKFIYIENQFFIGCLKDCPLVAKDLKNGIPEAILERIVRAANDQQKFTVIVIVPQHPNGDLVNSYKPRTIMHYEYATIRGIFDEFRKRVPNVDPFKYINFYCLNNVGVVHGRAYVDEVYVHDKILIQDDKVMIVGSANINDRSMQGNRDSEMAIRIEDTIKKTISLGGKDYSVSETIHNVRLKLMHEHTLSTESSLVDILDDDVFNKYWDGVAASNVQAMSNFLGDTSPYSVKTLADYRKAISDYPARRMEDPVSQKLFKRFRGHLATFPLDFLKDEFPTGIHGPSLALSMVGNDIWV